MNRRDFSLGLAGTALLAPAWPGRALASPVAPVDGVDYLTLKTPLALPHTGKVEVIEFFWYGCPHCYAFEPTIEPWIARLQPDIQFRRVHVGFSALHEIHQRVFYTWDSLGLVEAMHAKTFDRFHRQHKPINSEQDMLAFAQESGLDVAKVKAAWSGFTVNTRAQQARQLTEAYAIDGVPMLGVHGRYTTAPSMNGPEGCLSTVSALAGRLRGNV